MDLPNIEEALLGGCVLTASLSPKDLRVICIESTVSKLRGNGEHQCIEEALRYADDNLKAGSYSYTEEPKPKHRYVSGAPLASSRLDGWIRVGYKFYAEGHLVGGSPVFIFVLVLHEGTVTITKTGHHSTFWGAHLAALDAEAHYRKNRQSA